MRILITGGAGFAVLSIAAAYAIPSVALRFFNVYGERHALSNPYTGVAAIVAGRLLNPRRPLVFEDGDQTRDVIDVSDFAVDAPHGALLATGLAR